MPTVVTFSARTRKAEFQIMALKQATYLLLIHPSILEKQNNLNTIIKADKNGLKANYLKLGYGFQNLKIVRTDPITLEYREPFVKP